MWWWRKVRKAQISKEDRDLFERYGEAVIGGILAGASCPTAPDLQPIIPGNICLPENPGKCTAGRDWLTECRDAHERREQRLEFVEWAILLFILLEIALSIASLWHGRNQGIITSQAQAALLDQRDPAPVASTSSAAAQKPAPSQPTEQQKLKERVDALESQLKEAQAKADRAAMEKDYIERIQKEVNAYYEKAFNTQLATVTIIALIVGLIGWFGVDHIVQSKLTEASTKLREEFTEKLDDKFAQLEKSHAAHLKQLEDDLKLRSDWQFQFLQGIASVANKEYLDALRSFRKAVEYYKSGKRRDLLETRAGEISIANLFQIFSLTTENENDRDAHAREELKSKLFDGLEEELAQASLREGWLAPLVRDRKPSAPASRSSTRAAPSGTPPEKAQSGTAPAPSNKPTTK